MNISEPITTDQVETIMFLTGRPPSIIESSGGSFLIVNGNKRYEGWNGDGCSLRSAADSLIDDLTVYMDSMKAIAEVEEANKALAAEAERQRIEAEKDAALAALSGVERAELAWAESLEMDEGFDELARSGVNIAFNLIGYLRHTSDDLETDLGPALCFIQSTIIDSLLELEDVSFYHGSLLALAADVIEQAVGCDDSDFEDYEEDYDEEFDDYEDDYDEADFEDEDV